MFDKKKFVIHSHGVLIIALLFAAFNWILPDSSHRGPWPNEIIIAFVIHVLLFFGRFYVFSEDGIKAYLLGIRYRKIPWSDVKRLILFYDYTAYKRKDHKRYLVVEMLGCIPSFPEKGTTGEAGNFFLKNMSCAIRIRLKPSDWERQIEGVKEFHQIDAVYTWGK